MVKFCKHLFFFCRFASRVHVHSAQTGTGVLIDVLEVRENIAFGDKLCEVALAWCCVCLVKDRDSNN